MTVVDGQRTGDVSARWLCRYAPPQGTRHYADTYHALAALVTEDIRSRRHVTKLDHFLLVVDDDGHLSLIHI